MNYYDNQYPYYSGGINNPAQNNYGMNQQPRMSINGTFVGSIEEAQRCVIPSDGMIYCFPDFAHNAIYTKQVNMLDGGIIFKVFELKPQVQNQSGIDNNYVTRQEFDNLSSQLKAIIDQLGGNSNV